MTELWLDEQFDQSALDPRWQWLYPPEKWAVNSTAAVLRVEPLAKTDYWQKTHYGFAVDNGHFLNTQAAGDWVATTHVRFKPVHQYDQAGLMVRLAADCWLKTSVEYEPHGPSRLGAVVTNFAYSDWSTQDFVGPECWFRVRREGSDYTVEAASMGLPQGEPH
jgi:hypothetical protein